MYRIKKIFGGFGIHFFLILIAASCVLPLLWTAGSALKTQETIFTDHSLFPASPHLENFYHAWVEGNFGIYFLNSLWYAFWVVLGVVLVSSLAAYAFSRLEFPGKNILFYLVLITLMIPLPGGFVAVYVLLQKVGLLNRVGYVASQINFGLALAIYLMKTFFDNLPRDLEDAARIDGCSKLGIWRHVALPLAKPAIAVVVIFNVMNAWNEYLFALIIFQDPSKMPIQLGLMEFQGAHIVNYPLLMAGITIAMIPVIIIYFIMQRHIIKGIMSGAVVG